jgi:hypothetical protein
VDHVWEYFEQRKDEIAKFGLTLDDGFLFVEEDGSNGQRGRLWGRVIVNDRTFLQVSERVELLTESGIHRTDYAYYLIVDGDEIWGYERDPTHDPAVHRHDRDHNRYPCDPISFKDAMEKAWETAGREDSWAPSEQ